MTMQTPEHRAKISAALRGFRRTENPSYNGRHNRVRSARGNASTYLCEGCCGGKARDWAQVHGTDGMQVSDYVPLCRRCHQDYDGIHAKVAVTKRAKAA